MVSTWDWLRVSDKWASLRSRIRGGHAICEVEIIPAAQFLTLRLDISVATKAICVDLDGPGHAPPYLCVSDICPYTQLIGLNYLGWPTESWATDSLRMSCCLAL